MKLSHYTHIFSWPDDGESSLLYSTRASSQALVPNEIITDIAKECLNAESASALTDLQLLVEDRQQEKNDTLNMVRQLNDLRRVMNVSVIVNLHCNFRCRYCYEGDQKDTSIMSEETADQLISYIKQQFKPDMTRLTLDFYGGEPLLSTRLIRHIAGSLKPFIEDQRAVFEITLVTNGSLLTPKTVNKLLPFGLKRAKITIDGPPDNHNYFRPYRSGRASFDTIMTNVKQCADLLKIGLSGNFTKENYKQFPAFFDHLTEYDITPEKIHSLSFSPVMQVSDEFSPGFCGGCASCNEPWLAEAAPFLRQEIIDRGFQIDTIAPSLCMVDVDNSFVAHYDGSLYQCVAMIGHKEYACGDIWSGMTDYQQQYHVNHWQKEEKCRNCTYLPLCFGGCRYMAYQRNGTMSKVDCQKDFFDATLEAFIKQDVACL